MEELQDSVLMASMPAAGWIDVGGFEELIIRFFVNIIFVGIIIHFFYYPKSKRKDYYFTFSLIAVSIFLLIFLMGGVQLKVGFALGLFAIFGIIRYRTESVPIREMTYLFVIIAISAINGLAGSISYAELLATNFLFIFATWVCESNRWIKHVSTKLITYDNIKLIVPEKRAELISDLEKRTGLKIQRVEIGSLNFLKDSALIKIYYEEMNGELNTIDEMTKTPKVYEDL